MESVRMRALCCAAYFFLAMASYYILKPVREALFVHKSGYMNLPWVHIAGGLVTFIAANLYTRFARRVSGASLVVGSNLVVTACILGFWALHELVPLPEKAQEALAWAYYIWVAVYIVFVVTIFWSLAHSIFTPQEGGRYYGLIGAGGIGGGIIGGLIVGQLAARVGSVNLLLVSAALLFPCAFLGKVLHRSSIAGKDEKTSGPQIEGSTADLFRDPYILGHGILVFAVMAIFELADHQTQIVIHTEFKELDRRSEYFAHVYLIANTTGVLINVLLAGFVQSRYGPFIGIFALPFICALRAVLMVFSPTLAMTTLTLVLELAVQYSIFQSSKEMLYVPTSRAMKYVAKTFIDTFLFRFGIALGAFWIIVFPPDDDLTNISLRIAPIALVAMFVCFPLARRYRELTK